MAPSTHHRARAVALTLSLGLVGGACKWLGAPRTSEGPCGANCGPATPDALDRNACAAIPAAVWVEGEQRCQKPTSAADCHKVAGELVWNGSACAKAGEAPTFFSLCEDPHLKPASAHTIEVLRAPFMPATCQEVHNQLLPLTTIHLDSSELSDLSPLGGLTNLETLSLWNNQVSDLSPLAGLKKLRTLNVGHNRIGSLAPLGALHDLQTLIASENQITDIAPLKALTKLKYLDVASNRITDFSALTGRTFAQGFFSEGNPGAPIKEKK